MKRVDVFRDGINKRVGDGGKKKKQTRKNSFEKYSVRHDPPVQSDGRHFNNTNKKVVHSKRERLKSSFFFLLILNKQKDISLSSRRERNQTHTTMDAIVAVVLNHLGASARHW